MSNFRFKFMLVSSLGLIIHAVPSANYRIKHKDKYSREDRYEYACKMANRMRIYARATTKVYGLSRLPKDETYIMYPNHQGKYDAFGIALSVPEPCSVLFEKKQASRLLSRQVCGLIEATIIDHKDDRDKVRAIHDCIDQVNKGVNYVIFPEGGYVDNKNTLQEFYTGCFTVSLRTKTTIVPVCLYDSYKAMNSETLERVITQVHYLEPIPYEEYKDLKKPEIAALVKSRIQERLDLIESGKLDEEYIMLPKWRRGFPKIDKVIK